MGMEQADRRNTKSRTRIGAVSIFGVCILLVSAATQVISTDDPNAPVTLVYVDPIAPIVTSATAPDEVGKTLAEAEPPESKVLGVTVAREVGAPSRDPRVEGVILGDWPFADDGRRGRYVLSETIDGTRLTVANDGGASVTTPLAERAFGGGRLFTFGGNTSGDYVILGEDGTLSFGNVGGIWATFAPSR